MTKAIRIEGMSCAHCAAAVTAALGAVAGVARVTVSLADKCAVVELSGPVEDAALREAVEEEGFTVASIG